MSKIQVFTFGVISAIVTLSVVLPAAAHQAAVKGKTVTVIAGKPSEFGFKLSTKTVPHGTVTFKVTNTGKLPHSFKACSSPKGSLAANTCAGKGTAVIAPGGAATLTFTYKTAGKYEYLCTVAGHAAAGQKGILTVT
jgi:plastocyanin